MVPIAGRDLSHLSHQRLGVAQQQTLQQAAATEFLLQQAALQPISVTRGLHDGRAWRAVPAHEQRNADYTLVAHPRGFGRRARSHDVVQRDDGGSREIGVLQLYARFVEHVPERQRHQMQVRGQRLEFGRWQGGKKMVLTWTMER